MDTTHTLSPSHTSAVNFHLLPPPPALPPPCHIFTAVKPSMNLLYILVLPISVAFEPQISTTTLSRRSLLDFTSLVAAITLSSTVARAFIEVENYDCSYLKPARGTLRRTPVTGSASSVGGMGSSYTDRLNRFNWDENTSTVNIRSYNEIMSSHRSDNVQMWQSRNSISKSEFERAVLAVGNAKQSLQKGKKLANKSQWDQLTVLITSPVLNRELSMACSLLQSSSDFLSLEERAEIGFDWGSCAWRSNACGAQADAQEAFGWRYGFKLY